MGEHKFIINYVFKINLCALTRLWTCNLISNQQQLKNKNSLNNEGGKRDVFNAYYCLLFFLFYLFNFSGKENEDQKNAVLYDALFDFDVYVDIKIGIPTNIFD